MHITDHVHTLLVPFKVPLSPSLSLDRFVYCYVILGEEICLIDTGVAGTEDMIFDLIRSAGRHPEEITTIIQTHAHPDHVGSTKAIKAKCHCQVLIHEAEVGWLEDVDVQFAERPVPGFHNLVGGSVEVDRALKEGDKVDLGGRNDTRGVPHPWSFDWLHLLAVEGGRSAHHRGRSSPCRRDAGL